MGGLGRAGVGERAGRGFLEVEDVHRLGSEGVDVGGADGHVELGEGGADPVDHPGPVVGSHLALQGRMLANRSGSRQ